MLQFKNRVTCSRIKAKETAALAELQREQQMLLQKQSELNRKISLLQGGKPADAAPTPTASSHPPPAKEAVEPGNSSDEDDDEKGDDQGDDPDDWGLGQVCCPKTGKAPKQNVVTVRRIATF